MKNLANRIKSTISQLTADPKSSDDDLKVHPDRETPAETPQTVSVAKPEEKPAAVPIPPAAEKLLQAVPATAKGLAEELQKQGLGENLRQLIEKEDATALKQS